MDSDDRDGAGESTLPRARSVSDAARSRVGRRAILGLLATAGFGAGLARWSSVDGVRSVDRDEVPIVYGFARSDPADPGSVEPLQKTVPAEWFRDLSRALAVHRKLPATELTGFLGSYVVPGEFADPAASISIQSTAEALRDEVAGLSLEVDFSIEVFDDLPDPSGETGPLRPVVTADLDDRTVPGGVLCGHDETRGSLAPALYDPATGRRFFATANHLFGGSGVDHRGEPLYLYGESDRAMVGGVSRGFADLDVLLAEPGVDRAPASEIAEAAPGAVGGQFTKLGLADLQSRGEPLEKTGAVSGNTSGPIKGIDGVTFYTGEGVRTGQILWGDEDAFTDGDSGSVTYHVDPQDDDRVLVGGVNSARTWWPGANFIWGTAAYRIRDDHGLVF